MGHSFLRRCAAYLGACSQPLLQGAAAKSKTQLLKELQDSLLKEKLDQIEDEVRGGGRIVCNIDAVNFVNPLEGRPQEWPELTSWISQHSFSVNAPAGVPAVSKGAAV